MKAVIFAGGKGTRMGESSEHTPKPMMKVLGRNLLQHKIDVLPESITEVILVVGYLREVIMDFFGDSYNGKKITYVIQHDLRGTADCLFLCKEHLKNEDRFLVMMGDDIYDPKDMVECLTYDASIVIFKSDSLLGKAKIIYDEKDNLVEISEKWQIDEPGYINAGMYSLTPEIFKYDMVAIPGGEFGLPQTILSMKGMVPIKAIKSDFWIQVTTPENIEYAEKILKDRA